MGKSAPEVYGELARHGNHAWKTMRSESAGAKRLFTHERDSVDERFLDIIAIPITKEPSHSTYVTLKFKSHCMQSHNDS